MTEFGEAAVRYAKLGMAVLPLEPGKKKPIFLEWQNTPKSDVAMITRWWTQNPNANVGILTGSISQVFVFDVDGKNGGIPTYESLIHKHGQFPDTWQDVTGRGDGSTHFYFRYPNFQVRSHLGLFQGIDIKGEGGQVVAPPSIHPDTGKRYFWDGSREIEETAIAEAPMWLLEVLEQKTHQTHSDKFPISVKIPKGVQHDTLVAFGGKLRQLGLDASEILPCLMVLNQSRCEQPGPEANILAIADSMSKYQPSDANLVRTANRLWRVTKAKEVEHQAAADKRKVDSIDGLAVYRAPATEQREVIEGILANGLTLFSGRAKIGKSWISLQLALSVSQGRNLWGFPVLRPGRVVYAALEESQARTTKRMRKLQATESVLLQNISMVYRLLPLVGGGREQIEELIKQQSPNLLIIDTWTALVGNGGPSSGNVFRAEYAEMNILHGLAEKYDLSILVVHHTNKTLGAKGFAAVAGSGAMTAAPDAVWVMEKEDPNICSVQMEGRDFDDQTLAIRFVKDPERFGWELMGTGEEVKSRKEDNEIFTLLRSEGALAPSRVAGLLKMNANRVRAVMFAMYQRGALVKNSGGAFALSSDRSQE